MMDVLRFGVPGKMDANMLHHPQIAVEYDVAVEHRVTDEPLVARAHDDGRTGLKLNRVEPLA